MTSRDATYRAFVQSYNAATGVVSCTIPKLYGAAIFTAKPAISSAAEIPSIAPPRAGSQIFVFFDGGVDNAPFWIPRVMDGAFDDAYVNVTGDTMTGELLGTDITLSGDLTAVNSVLSGNLTAVDGVFSGNATISGDAAVNGGDLTSSATTFNLLATPTTVHIAHAATTVSIGATTGLTTIRNRVLANGVGVNEQITIQVTGSPTGGSFVLLVAGVPVTLAYNSTTLNTTNAFNAQLGSGAVTVTGGTFPGATQVVTFTADYAGSDIQLPEFVVNQLTGGTSPSVSVTLTTAGAGALSASTVAAGVVSGPRALFNLGQFGSLFTAAAGTNITTRTADPGSSALVIPATLHAVSERAGITLGDWIIGQDLVANGTKDFFFWNGLTRLSITPSGTVSVGPLVVTGLLTTSSGASGTTGIDLGNGIGWFTQDTTWARLYTGKSLWTSSGWIGNDAGITLGFGGVTDANNRVYANGNGYFNGNVRAVGQLYASRNAGSAYAGATSDSYLDATIRADPANTWGASTASISFHSSGVAPQLRVGWNDPQVYNRTYDGVGNNPFTASAFNVASTVRIKKNVTEWPLRSGGAAAESALDRFARLRVVTFDRDEPGVLKEVPVGRRSEAYERLLRYTRRNNLPDYELPDHDCSVHTCDGSADDPCARHLNTHHSEFGLIAEEVHEVFPEAVNYDSGRAPYSINYSMISAITIAAVKELLEKVRELEARLAA